MKKIWSIDSGEAVHNVVYCRNLFGNARITIDDDTFPLGHVGSFKQRTEPFRVGDFQCMLIMKGSKVRIESNDCTVALV